MYVCQCLCFCLFWFGNFIKTAKCSIMQLSLYDIQRGTLVFWYQRSRWYSKRWHAARRTAQGILGRLFRVDLIKPVSNVHPSVHPHQVSSISMKFGRWVEVDEWCTMACSMARSKVKFKVTSPWKLQIFPFSTAISPAIYNGSWQLTMDS